MKSRKIDMTGIRYSSVIAVKEVGITASRDTKWLFICDCGNNFEANGYYVRSGKVKDCPSCAAGRVRIASVKHGLSNTAEFSTWTDIQTRCYNKNAKAYSSYGGRGIKVCVRWLESFDNFINDMGNRPANKSIDRIDNDGNYEPSNCHWATVSQQQRNKRNKHLIEIDGVKKHLCEWAKEFGLNASTILIREKSGLFGKDLIAPSKHDGCIKFNGVTDTYAGWSNRTGIKISTIAMRINSYKWSIEKSLTKGAKFC